MIAEALLRPEAPLKVAGDLPAAGGALGHAPEDFRVSELALYLPSGTGDHLYVRVEKRSMTTPELVTVLARAAEVRERDVGYAGMKDKHAITEQWLSLPGSARNPDSWALPESVRLLAASRHNNKLRTGHLKGNHFVVTLRDVPDGGLERAQAIFERIRQHGLYNYFGEQRFGRGGNNVQRALEWLRGNGSRNKKKARFDNKLYPSVIQAEVFNRYLTRRQAQGLKRLIAGEVVRLQGTGSSFVVEEVSVEQPRLEQGDIVLTGPVFGPKAKAARHAALELESEARLGLGLGADELARLGRLAPGTRRDLLVSLHEATLESPHEGTLELRFFLPAGSYATQLVREFTASPWCETR